MSSSTLYIAIGSVSTLKRQVIFRLQINLELKNKNGGLTLIELFLFIPLGSLFIVFGWRIWKKEQIGLIHDYHHQRVSEENQLDYSEKIGKSVLLMGVGMILTGIIDYLTNTFYGWVIFISCFIVALIIIMRSQKKYNSGIF